MQHLFLHHINIVAKITKAVILPSLSPNNANVDNNAVVVSNAETYESNYLLRNVSILRECLGKYFSSPNQLILPK